MSRKTVVTMGTKKPQHVSPGSGGSASHGRDSKLGGKAGAPRPARTKAPKIGIS